MKATTLIALIAFAGVFHSAVADCPNACSGHGTCGAFDMCTCYRNWQANDCSERTCPFSYAFVTTPQGDLNMDGDRKDNSFKPLSQTVSSLPALSTQVIFNAALQAGEITAGDGIWIEGVSSIVATHTSGTASLTLADVHTAGITQTNPTAYRFLENIPSPQGTWESWPGDYYAAAAAKDEGHFYMECSNRGLCDRKTGICKCFPGYDGHACARTTCPNSCSGHGTCEYVSELRIQQPKTIAGCTVEGNRGAYTLTTSTDCSAASFGFAVADYLKIGDAPVAISVTAISATAITLADPLPKDFVYGTGFALQTKYDLWDADKNRACKCDARWSGYDCSEQKCPVGDDPLTTGQIWETQTINIGGADPANTISGSFKLTFTDMFGEKWTTTDIPVSIPSTTPLDNSATVAAALKALPNDVIQDVTVTSLSINDKGVRYMVKFNGGTTATATGNSGDLPLMGCDGTKLNVLLTANIGDADGFSYQTGAAIESAVGTGITATTDGTSTTVTFGAAYLNVGTAVTDLADGDTVVIGTASRVLKGNWGTIANGATTVKTDRAFPALSAAITRAGTALTDYTKTVTFKGTKPTTAELIVGDLLDISGEQRQIASVTINAGKVDSATITAPYTAVSASGTVQAKVARNMMGNVDCTVTDIAAMMPATWAAAYVTGEVGTGTSTEMGAAAAAITGTSDGLASTVTLSAATGLAMNDGDTLIIGTELRLLVNNGGAIAIGTTGALNIDAPFTAGTANMQHISGDARRQLTLSAAVDAKALAIGDKVLIKTMAGSAAEQIVTVTKITGAVINTEEKMDKHTATSPVYNYAVGNRENAECSNRGLCDSGTGQCKCFRGYTFDDCSRQNALAL